ncbi:MAG: LamB/YcsF family protein [Gemmatimonadota bacterium]|nr:LamB/YcsF family protein [Gemmatimonadota bacterium]
MLINCDMGESYGPWEKGADDAVMPLIDWANIACGGHAGDPDTMARTLSLAAEHDVQAGAHPGYPDRRNFGRLRLDWPPDSLVREIQAQIGALQAIAAALGTHLHHVKPHGALYLAMMNDDRLLTLLAEGVAAVDPSLTFVLQATPDRERHAAMLGHTRLPLAFEAFADRAYASDGRLQPRSIPGAVLSDHDAVARHVANLLGGFVETPEGPLPVRAETLCVHGDNPSAREVLRRIRELVPRGG